MDIRQFETLGHADHGWLDARHHFSFSSYHDPKRMGWGAIRVWNDDTIAPNSGFPPHPHKDMEIVTYVRSGAITHKDSMGNVGRTAAGDVQVMSAGTGVTHSEFNLEGEPTTLFQIWIEARNKDAKPGWGAKAFPKGDRGGKLEVLASGMGDDGALTIQADARVLAATLSAGQSVEHVVAEGRHAYLVPATGSIEVDGIAINARDGVALDAGNHIIKAVEESEIVLVDAE